MAFQPITALIGKYDLGATVAGTNQQSTHASAMNAQVSTTTAQVTGSPAAGGSLGTTANASADPDARMVMYGAVGIVVAALILLWVLGAIVFKKG